MNDQEALNTDQEIWREFTGEPERGDYIFVTTGNGIGINVGGTAIVKPLKEWFQLAVDSMTIQNPFANPPIKRA